MVDTLKYSTSMFCFASAVTVLFGGHMQFIRRLKTKLRISVAGIPKTIDNDIDLIHKSFGFGDLHSQLPTI